MVFYKFTRDIRTATLIDKLKDAAHKIRTDTVPLATENKSENNNINTLRSYFGLEKGSNNLREAEFGDPQKVIINFMSKFQFPNARSKSHYNTQVSENTKLKPYQVIVKLLYFGSLSQPDFYLTISEILDFIFKNNKVIHTVNLDYQEIFQQILEFRRTGKLPQTIDPNLEWAESMRELRDMLQIMEYSDFIEIENARGDDRKYKLVSNLTQLKNNVLLANLLFENNYLEWEDGEEFNSFKERYTKYMDIESIEIDSNTEEYNIDCNLRDDVVQSIQFGAPGTGKSHGISKIIRQSYPDFEDSSENPFVIRTTIYDDYSYFDFVGNLLPHSENNEISYKFTPGPFTLALIRAFKNPSNDVYLIVEEMSRGNIASIFGDIFQLLDRKQNGISQYKIDNSVVADELNKRGLDFMSNKIYLPRNFHIIGTVNTSDQNVNVLDTAFKRRFSFIYNSVDPVKVSGQDIFENSITFQLGDKEFEWNQFYMAINKMVVSKLGLSEDKQLGQFFVNFSNVSDPFLEIKNKVLNYLWEDIQNVRVESDEYIFKEEILAFSDLYKKFANDTDYREIFSDDFIKVYDELDMSIFTG